MAGEAGVPVFEEDDERAANLCELALLALDRSELLRGKSSDTATRRAAALALAEDAGELRNGEPHGERGAHDTQTLD